MTDSIYIGEITTSPSINKAQIIYESIFIDAVFNSNYCFLSSDKINLDELYEKKRKYDLNKLEIYNKLLARIHNKIKVTARQKIDEQFCWFNLVLSFNLHSIFS